MVEAGDRVPNSGWCPGCPDEPIQDERLEKSASLNLGTWCMQVPAVQNPHSPLPFRLPPGPGGGDEDPTWTQKNQHTPKGTSAMVGVIISLLVTIMVVVILLKKMKAQFVLFFGGLPRLLVCSIAMDAFGLRPTAPRSFRRASPARAASASTSSKASSPMMSSRTAGTGLDHVTGHTGRHVHDRRLRHHARLPLQAASSIFRSPYFVFRSPTSSARSPTSSSRPPPASRCSRQPVRSTRVLVRLGASRPPACSRHRHGLLS